MSEEASVGEWRVEWDTDFPVLIQPNGEPIAPGRNGEAELHAIAAAMNARAWRPIESAPRDGTRVLLFDRLAHSFVGYWDSDRWANPVSTMEFRPTAWQPLPPPPEDAP